MAYRGILAVTSMAVILIANVSHADVTMVSIATNGLYTGISSEFIRGQRVFLAAATFDQDLELGLGYALSMDNAPIAITPLNSTRGLRPDQLYLTPMVSWRGTRGDPPVIHTRIRMEWMVNNRIPFTEPRYVSSLFELEPGLLLQSDQGTIQHIVSRLTIASAHIGTRQFGIEYIIDVFPATEANPEQFRRPGEQTPRRPVSSTARVQGYENWFAAWPVPLGYLRLSVNKGQLADAISVQSSGRRNRLDWQLRYVYRRYK